MESALFSIQEVCIVQWVLSITVVSMPMYPWGYHTHGDIFEKSALLLKPVM